MIITASLLALGSAGLLILALGWGLASEASSQRVPGSAAACL